MLLRVMVVNKGQAGAVTKDFNPRNRMKRMGCFPCSKSMNATPARIAPIATMIASNLSAAITWSARAEKIKGERMADKGRTMKVKVT